MFIIPEIKKKWIQKSVQIAPKEIYNKILELKSLEVTLSAVYVRSE